MNPVEFEKKLKGLPASPGCYLFRDSQNRVLYVGKAKSLRARVRSYFQDGSSDTRAFIPLLRRHVVDLETLVTRSEKEAAILENSLIKEHQPRYNVKLRDDKEYLSLKLNTDHDWPRLSLVRRPTGDGASYFGPYHSATAARRTLHLVEKHFQLRTCNDRELEQRRRPCLQYQIKRCPAPCVYEVDRELYGAQVRAVGLFLDGRHDELTRELRARMATASESLEYEVAGIYRDQLHAVESIRQEQRVVSLSDKNQDVLGLFREADLAELSVMIVRSGRVVDVMSFSNKRVEVPDDELVATFLREHYGDGGAGEAYIPDEVLVPVLPEGAQGVEEWLTDRRQQAKQGRVRPARGGTGRCQLFAPARGARKQLLDLATENARHAFHEKQRAEEDMDQRLLRIQERLRLPTLPRRVECCDISHLGGKDTVGSVVAFKDGAPDKKRYKLYKVKTVEDGDDYGAMYEVLSRRFKRGAEATDDDTWQLPDLFVVDGGPGQLAVALAAAHDLGLHDLTVVGLAKEREKPLAEKVVDRIYLTGQKNPISLKPNTPELFLLAHARDEAHRFANHGRKQVGRRRRMASELDAVPGVGPKTRVALLNALGSVEKIRQASDQEILAVPGVGRRQLEALRSFWASTATHPTHDSSPRDNPPNDN